MIDDTLHSVSGPEVQEYLVYVDTDSQRLLINYFSDITDVGITKLCAEIEKAYNSVDTEDTSDKTNKLTNSNLENDSNKKSSTSQFDIEISNDDIPISIFLSVVSVLRKAMNPTRSLKPNVSIYLSEVGFERFQSEPQEVKDKFKDMNILSVHN